jgi:hypothetical protein
MLGYVTSALIFFNKKSCLHGIINKIMFILNITVYAKYDTNDKNLLLIYVELFLFFGYNYFIK